MADHRPGFTPGEVGERAGRADARPRLTCSLATVSQEFAMRFSDAVKRHRAHGGDLGQCDALRCSCRNQPYNASAVARCTQNRMSSSSWPRSHHWTDGDLAGAV